MSTRRARIKAVAVLPPRRKNADNADANKKETKELTEVISKSPKIVNNERSGAFSPVMKSPSQVSVIRSPTPLSPRPKTLSETATSSKHSSAVKDLMNDFNLNKSPPPVPIFHSPSPVSPTQKPVEINSSPQVLTNAERPQREFDCEDTLSNNKDGLTRLSPRPRNISENATSPRLSNAVKDLMKDFNLNKSPPPVPIFHPPSPYSPSRKPVEVNLSPQVLSNAERTQRESDCEDNSSNNKDALTSLSNSISKNKRDLSASLNIAENKNQEDLGNSSEDASSNRITPVQSTGGNLDKLIDSTKNDIASDNSEFSSDTVIRKPRQKLRPIPRLGPHRRNSVQGSASESEDESRRTLLSSGPHTPAPTTPTTPRIRHDSQTSQSVSQSIINREPSRTRNDSMCSNVSQVQAPPVTSPVKDKNLAKVRRHEMSKRMWRRRRETNSQALTMYDLIFFNPTSNPIVPDEDELKAKEENAKTEAENKAKKEENEEEAEEGASAAPVPQIKLGPNGEIVLDESSLVIKQCENRKVSSVVREGRWGGGGGRYSRAPRSLDWSPAETVRFYRALAALGTDFSLMAQLFPDRNRRELKIKFKKEEKLNGFQVDKALRSATTWDVEQLLIDFQEEREKAASIAAREKQKLIDEKQAERERLKALKDAKQRQSRASKAIESRILPTTKSNELTTADEFIERALEQKKEQQKEREKRAETRKRQREQEVIQRLGIVSPAPQPKESLPEFATLTLTKHLNPFTAGNDSETRELATISRVKPGEFSKCEPKRILNTNAESQIPDVPANIENGSLVVLRVNDPKSPTKTMLQTYIARGAGKLTPVALPQTLLNSVMGYMTKKKPGTPNSTGSSSQPNTPIDLSTTSRSPTPGVIQANPSPVKRQRHSSYCITTL